MTYHHPPDAAPLAVPYQAVTNDNNNNNNSSSAFNATETGQQQQQQQQQEQDGGVYTISPGSSVTLPVACVCGEKARCACEEVHDEAYAKTVLEDAAKSDSSGGGGMQDKAVLRVINDTMTLVVNGSVPDTSAAVGASEQAGLWLWMMVAVAAAAAAVGLV